MVGYGLWISRVKIGERSPGSGDVIETWRWVGGSGEGHGANSGNAAGPRP